MAQPTQGEDTSREELFNAFFVDGDETVIQLKKKALNCELKNSKLRVLSWKLFLGVLSTPPRYEEWIREITKPREQYSELKKKYFNLSLDDVEDPNVNNPLSLDSNSPWSKFFENEQLRKTILQDVERIYPEYDYFQEQWVRDMMMNILFIYAKENPHILYKQGMHELLAPIIYTIDQEKMTLVEGSMLSMLLDKDHIEDDAYILFDKLMKTVNHWFVCQPAVVDKDGKTITPADSPILSKCNNIFFNLLKSNDPGLFSYIESINIEPQLFLLRWIRCLFGREFPLFDTLVLWDAIFAYDKWFTLIDYISVAMIIEIRELLLSTDQNGVLQLLFIYPLTLVQVSSLVENSLKMVRVKTKKKTIAPPPPQGLPVPQEGEPATTSASEPGQLKWVHETIANRLDSIVGILQNDLLFTKIVIPETVQIAVAELKQLKDVMCGYLPLEVLPTFQSKKD